MGFVRSAPDQQQGQAAKILQRHRVTGSNGRVIEVVGDDVAHERPGLDAVQQVAGQTIAQVFRDLVANILAVFWREVPEVMQGVRHARSPWLGLKIVL